LTEGVEQMHRIIMAWAEMPPEAAAPPKGGLSAGLQHD